MGAKNTTDGSVDSLPASGLRPIFGAQLRISMENTVQHRSLKNTDHYPGVHFSLYILALCDWISLLDKYGGKTLQPQWECSNLKLGWHPAFDVSCL